MAAYGKSTRWENFSTKRFKRLAPGRHTASVWIRGQDGHQCSLNGMGMDGEWGCEIHVRCLFSERPLPPPLEAVHCSCITTWLLCAIVLGRLLD